MRKLATLPNVFVKLSMLGFAVPGWWDKGAVQMAAAKGIVKDLVAWFGPQRCMFASNWHINAVVSDSDGLSSSSPSPSELVRTMAEWLTEFGLSEAERASVFADTARRFYRLE